MSDRDKLKGRVIAIAGAGGGLGPVVAKRLAADGASLALTDVRQEALDPVVEELGLPEERIDARVVDLLDEQAASGWAADLQEKFGRIDGLVHLVGGWRGGEPIETASLEDYEWLHDLLVRTVQRASRAFYGPLTESGHGCFILISSSQAQAPEGTNAAYAAAKAAAESWTMALADAFAKDEGGATANIIVVNAILTPAMREKNPDKEYPSFTSTEDIAEACAFLCSDSGARMNGKRLPLHP
ncbi:MAG: SDR family oxidoreductase [Solirubrobacterales bacterium]